MMESLLVSDHLDGGVCIPEIGGQVFAKGLWAGMSQEEDAQT